MFALTQRNGADKEGVALTQKGLSCENPLVCSGFSDSIHAEFKGTRITWR